MNADICKECSAPATHSVGTVWLCTRHNNDLLDPIRARVILPEGFDGTGQPTALRLDWGEQFHDLECTQCEATWVGWGGEQCPYCAGLYERSVTEQKQLVLRPTLPEPEHPRRKRAESAWAERLAVAVIAGLVEEREARWALERAVKTNAA
jgi:hypothetical protein